MSAKAPKMSGINNLQDEEDATESEKRLLAQDSSESLEPAPAPEPRSGSKKRAPSKDSIDSSFSRPVKPQMMRGVSGASVGTSTSANTEPDGLPFILTERAKLGVGLAVLLNALAMTVEVEVELRLDRTNAVALAMYGVQLVFLVVFIIELILNVRCFGLSFFYRRGGGELSSNVFEAVRELGIKIHFQGIFDFFVVLAAVLDLCIMRPLNMVAANDGAEANKTAQAFSTFRVLQLFRLARIFQLLRLSQELSTLAFNLAMSLRAVFWVFLLLFTLIYMGALFCASELGSSENEKLQKVFGNVWVSIFSHFKLMTLEQWVDICNWAMEENPIWAVYFLSFIILTNLTLVNLVTGLIITGVVEHAKEEDWSWQEKLVEEEPFINAIKTIVEEADLEGQLHLEMLETLLADLRFQAILSLYGISVQMTPQLLLEILTADGPLEVEELARALLRLRGSKQCFHPLMVRRQIAQKGKAFQEQLKDIVKEVPKTFQEDLAQMEENLRGCLTTLDKEVRGKLRPAKSARRRSCYIPEEGAEPVLVEPTSAEVPSETRAEELSRRLLPPLHSACESVEVLRARIAEASAELRRLQVEEHQLEVQLAKETRVSRGMQASPPPEAAEAS